MKSTLAINILGIIPARYYWPCLLLLAMALGVFAAWAIPVRVS